MFERFTEDARHLLVEAQSEARGLGHCWIGTEHLLLAASRPGSAVAEALHDLGLTHSAVRAQVLREVGPGGDDGSEALRALGIDLDEVRRRVEESFGAGALDEPPSRHRARRWRPWSRRRRCAGQVGHIPFTRFAKKSLELALREALQLRSGEIAVAHVVLGTMRAGGLASRTVTALGVRPEDVRRVVLAQLGRAA